MLLSLKNAIVACGLRNHVQILREKYPFDFYNNLITKLCLKESPRSENEIEKFTNLG
jgi:hypothetical protein